MSRLSLTRQAVAYVLGAVVTATACSSTTYTLPERTDAAWATEDIRRMFPADIADTILKDSQRLRP